MFYCNVYCGNWIWNEIRPNWLVLKRLRLMFCQRLILFYIQKFDDDHVYDGIK
jgi:hypothetical protein